ncbi:MULTISPECIES: hypothetical protein [Niastella]|uniref:Lipoprotein n=1 Tax=Niastella soli TaxID=2821487 RepID=A0ABS3Z505_9BACT|nr:hypothetical protein [Niastella soli]MBO9205123.1 hypothetical protein [Niastella soli]
MANIKCLTKLFLFLIGTLLLTGCGLVFGLFYKDWHTEVAYRSSSSKKDYFIIEGVTQSHCGCSDVIVKNYKNKQLDFTFYYGGGLFPGKKYIYQYDANAKITDTLTYIPVTTDSFTLAFDSLDKVILQRIDTLITNRPSGSGLTYEVNRQNYKGFVRQN